MKLGDGWLKGAEPRESGKLETRWTITLTFRDEVADGAGEERMLDRQYDRICEALRIVTARDGLTGCDISDDPEKEWL